MQKKAAIKLSSFLYRSLGIDLLVRRHRLRIILRSFFQINKAPSNNPLKVTLVLKDGLTHPKSSAFIRLIAPLSHPSIERGVRLNITDENKLNVSKNTDVCIVQRTAIGSLLEAERFVSHLRNNSIKLVVDTDDAFGLIDESHPEYSSYTRRREALEYLVRLADQVWVSTQPLVNLHEKQNKNTVVVPNTLDDRLWHSGKTLGNIANDEPIHMVYMGTATHDADFNMIMKALDVVAKKFPTAFDLSIIGVSSQALPDRAWIKRISQPRGISIYPYFVGWFQNQGPFDVGLCPLIDNPFNNCKSDIKCLDYIAADIIPVASNVPSYSTPGLQKHTVSVDNSLESWVRVLSDIVENPKDFRAKKQTSLIEAQKYLWTERSTSKTALKILNSLKLDI